MEFTAKLKEKFEEVKEKASSGEVAKFFREKGGLIVGSILLIVVVTVSVALVSNQEAQTAT